MSVSRILRAAVTTPFGRQVGAIAAAGQPLQLQQQQYQQQHRSMSALPAPEINPEIQTVGVFINNEFRPSISGKVFPTVNPATGEVICEVAEGDKADVDVAVDAAARAFEVGIYGGVLVFAA